jgi:hypothetical protein
LCEGVSGKQTSTFHGYKRTVYFKYMTPTYKVQHYLHPINHANITQFESKFRPINTTTDRWRDNIKIDLTEIGCKGVDWNHMALGNTVMN